jgi:hypothetical protein
MQLAGQICGQRPQATHLERPCSSVSIRWVPRHRGESEYVPNPCSRSVLFCSGYCIVTFFSSMCLKVSAIPLSVART